MSMLGPSSFKKAIEEAEKLSESLKLRYRSLSIRLSFLCPVLNTYTLLHRFPQFTTGSLRPVHYLFTIKAT